ncbi:hypothetical protein SAMN04487936_107164 [Halobacillus dabanensis]|uniref:Uncharacterized protein n=1 Tax=Halobacillus dabanensis TaxID=240302 RepID=A0A1I3WVW3_HALDA|nr:hypothetical protein [Halobacillus dabanensis]SFK11433.1 hypothetical protein SAMN04487936_107164 [Halobacillus dabanensis]
MIYAYISPLLIVTLILVSTIFIIDWLTKVLIYIFLVNLMVLPGLLLFIEEAKDKKLRQPSIKPSITKEEKQDVEKNVNS